MSNRKSKPRALWPWFRGLFCGHRQTHDDRLYAQAWAEYTAWAAAARCDDCGLAKGGGVRFVTETQCWDCWERLVWNRDARSLFNRWITAGWVSPNFIRSGLVDIGMMEFGRAVGMLRVP